MAGNGNVDLNKIVVGFPHQGTYAEILENGKSLVVTFPRVPRSIRVYVPVPMLWLPTSGVTAALLTKLSVPVPALIWHERVRQFPKLVLHNASGGDIAADLISWDAELTEVLIGDYPLTTAANGFEGYGAEDYTVATTIAEETPA